MITKITRELAQTMGFDFEELVKHDSEISYEEHRRGSNFYTRMIVTINEEWFPTVPRELDGFWESNTYISDADWGHETIDIQDLNRVVQIEETRVIKKWVKIEEAAGLEKVPTLYSIDQLKEAYSMGATGKTIKEFNQEFKGF